MEEGKCLCLVKVYIREKMMDWTLLLKTYILCIQYKLNYWRSYFCWGTIVSFPHLHSLQLTWHLAHHPKEKSDFQPFPWKMLNTSKYKPLAMFVDGKPWDDYIYIVGGWNNPFQKHISEIGSSPKKTGVCTWTNGSKPPARFQNLSHDTSNWWNVFRMFLDFLGIFWSCQSCCFSPDMSSQKNRQKAAKCLRPLRLVDPHVEFSYCLMGPNIREKTHAR